ncbi:hypothetical protein CCP4SC76_3910003 [Gammaproteobacteria bacterium]
MKHRIKLKDTHFVLDVFSLTSALGRGREVNSNLPILRHGLCYILTIGVPTIGSQKYRFHALH